jgi:hypothetical protein
MKAFLMVLVLAGMAFGQATTQPLKVQAPPADASNGELREMVVALQRQVVELQRQNEWLRRQLTTAQATQQPATADAATAAEAEAIAKAIREKRLAVGMTLEQAKQALASWYSVKKTSESAGGVEEYQWEHYENSRVGHHDSHFVLGTTATFANGKLVRWDDW